MKKRYGPRLSATQSVYKCGRFPKVMALYTKRSWLFRVCAGDPESQDTASILVIQSVSTCDEVGAWESLPGVRQAAALRGMVSEIEEGARRRIYSVVTNKKKGK